MRILDGTISEPTSCDRDTFTTQEIGGGWRLACQFHLSSDIEIYIPPESMTTPQRMQLEGVEIEIPVEPPVKFYMVTIPSASLSDQRADTEHLLAVLNEKYQLNCDKIDNNVMELLPVRLKTGDLEIQVAVRDQEVIAISSLSSRELGFVADLGSTKIAGYLVDLNDGRTLVTKGVVNPQISYGEDIVSRISAAASSQETADELQSLVTEALDRLAGELCNETGLIKEEIIEAVVVANTAMHHLFLGLPVGQLAVYPFMPATIQALDIKANELNLQFTPGAYVYVLPNIAMFVGADHVATLLATEAYLEAEPVIVIDIGTNTEVSLICKGKIITASCASGPAFEGGHIKDGMRAIKGAIERVRIASDKVEFQTIDDGSPIGICGSGILDTIAQLLSAGVIDSSGRMSENHCKVRNTDSGRDFILVEHGEKDGKPPIVFTQQDVRQLQLGKAAIRTGIQILLEDSNCREEDITKVIIAGAFGSYIDVSSAIAIGMLPALPLEKYHQVGNAAGMGAKRAIISLSQRIKASEIAKEVRHIELSTVPDFNKTFTQSMFLGKYRIRQGEREEIS